MTTVTKLDDTTTAVNNGTSVLLLKDLNKDGVVDAVAVGTQNEAQLYFGDLSGDNVILTGEHGDPHVRQKLFFGEKTTALKASLNALLADAGDGTLNNGALLTTAIAQTVNGGVNHEITDLQADHILQNGSSKAKVDVEALNDKVAFAENAVFSFADGKEYAIRNLWNRSGNDGAIGVGLAGANEGGQSKGTFVTMDEKKMGLAGTTFAFGAEYGSVGAYVLNVQGKLDIATGQASAFWPNENDYFSLYKSRSYGPGDNGSASSPPTTSSGSGPAPAPAPAPAPGPAPSPAPSPIPGGGGNTIEDQIKAFYLSYLHRSPDAEGFSYWVNQVTSKKMTMAQVGHAIQFSPEAKVYGFYLQYLKREPDAGGLAYWRDQIRNGHMTEAQVENAIKNSPEAQNLNK